MMSLAPGFKDIRDLLARLQRQADLLDSEVTADRFVDFCITAYSMIDWIRNDPTLPPSARTRAAINGLYAEQSLKACGDIATAAKHLTLTTRKPIVSSTRLQRGWGAGRFGKGRWGYGEEEVAVVLQNGTIYQCLDLARAVIRYWVRFCAKHGI
jgi:hypothetical protein